jgi:hypothetical protein
MTQKRASLICLTDTLITIVYHGVFVGHFL